MDHCDMDLQELVATGKAQGYLTYDQVNEYLPDEAVTPEKLDNLLIALEQLGIELVNEAPDLEPEVLSIKAAGAAKARRPRKKNRSWPPCRSGSYPSSATIRCGCI